MQFDNFGSLHINHTTRKNRFLFVNWNLGSLCTYSCSYCPYHSHDGSHKWPESEVALNIANKINDVYRSDPFNKEKVCFELLGGEVTLWNGLTQLCEAITTKGNVIRLVSNGVRTTDWWKRHAQYFTGGVTLSYHPEFADHKHIAEVSEILAEQNIFVVILVLVYPEKWDACVEAFEYFKNFAEFNFLELQKLTLHEDSKSFEKFNGEEITHKHWPYSEQENRWIRENVDVFRHKPNQHQDTSNFDLGFYNTNPDFAAEKASSGYLYANQMNSWKGWQCNVGIDTLYLEQNGDIRRDANCRTTPPIGYWRGGASRLEEVKWPSQPVICPRDQCYCSHDFAARKQRL